MTPRKIIMLPILVIVIFQFLTWINCIVSYIFTVSKFKYKMFELNRLMSPKRKHPLNRC